MLLSKSKLLGLAAGIVLSAQAAFGGAIVPGFDSISLPANDDFSTDLEEFNLGALDFFGVTVTGGYLNNNGNITFSGPENAYTPTAIQLGTNAMIAPFFADVDTRAAGSAVLSYGNGTFGGRNAFGVTWNGVGYYAENDDKLNKFQVLLVERSDIAAGDFDIYFNYDQIQWETGEASGGTEGLGGDSARVGYSDGAGTYFELAGSGVNGAFLDGGPNSLVANSLNSTVAGRYLFEVRGGSVSTPEPAPVPDGGITLLLVGLALAGIARANRKSAA